MTLQPRQYSGRHVPITPVYIRIYVCIFMCTLSGTSKLVACSFNLGLGETMRACQEALNCRLKSCGLGCILPGMSRKYCTSAPTDDIEHSVKVSSCQT